MTYGFHPWQQTSWDARAAANFIAGGLGSGLIVFAALANARGSALAMLMIAGLGIVAVGLACVWAEIGRPLRALNVFRQPRRSWMAREALAALPLFIAGGIAAYTGSPTATWVAASCALVFVYCQARILRGARGIPAWRDPRLTPYIVVSSLAEGAGLFWMCVIHLRIGTSLLLSLFGALAILRVIAWLVYRRSVGARAAAPALRALDRAGRVLQIGGTLIPIVLVAIVATGVAGAAMTLPLSALAGAAVVVSGGWVKAALVLRAGFNQGFALPHLPVRGVRP